jgi:hypothetical protein
MELLGQLRRDGSASAWLPGNPDAGRFATING